LTGRTARRRVVRVTLPSDAFPGGAGARPDLLAAEEPLGIRVDGSALTVTMHTPGDDVELAAGLLVGDAVVRSHDDIAGIRLCDGTSSGQAGDVADLRLQLRVGGEPKPLGPVRLQAELAPQHRNRVVADADAPVPAQPVRQPPARPVRHPGPGRTPAAGSASGTIRARTRLGIRHCPAFPRKHKEKHSSNH
jgi:hypothetical protein